MNELTFVALAALSAFGVIEVVRALPFSGRLFEEGRKPFSCDVCMSFWTIASFAAAHLVSAYMHGDINSVPALSSFVVAFSLAIILLRQFGRRPPPPALLGGP